MATAPTPGVGKRTETANAAQQILTITVRGETHKIAPFNLPLKEDLILAKATQGMTVEGLLSAMDDPTKIGLRPLKILWWLARRAGGEWQLTLERAWDEWPDDLDAETELEVEIGSPGDEANDPEA